MINNSPQPRECHPSFCTSIPSKKKVDDSDDEYIANEVLTEPIGDRHSNYLAFIADQAWSVH